jgi:hypothetical protein
VFSFIFDKKKLCIILRYVVTFSSKAALLFTMKVMFFNVGS